MDDVAVKREAEVKQDLLHAVLVDIGAEQGVYLVRLKQNGLFLDGLRHYVDDAIDDLAAAEQFYKLAGAVHGAQRTLRVKTLFKAGGRVGTHTEGSSGAAHGGAVEIRALEENHRRVADNLAVLAAHDARNSDGLVGVADAEHGGGQLALGAVKRTDALALARGADVNLVVADAGKVERVHGLAVLQHDVVRDVDDVVYRAHTGVADTLTHPARGRRDLDVLDHARGVARAERGILDDDLRHVVDIAAGLRFDDRLVQLQLLAEGHGGLTRETDNAQAVRPVRGYLKFHDVVVAAEDDGHIVAGLAVLVENEDTVGNAVRELLLLRAEIIQRKYRILLGVIGHEIARVDVLAVGHGIGRGFAEVERDLPQAVALVLHVERLCRDDAAENLVSGLDVGGDGGLCGIDRMVVAEDGGGLYLRVGEIVQIAVKLLERAEHTGGLHAAQLALRYLHAAGQQGIVQRRGDEIAAVDVPRAGAYLHRLRFADVYLRDEHVVGVGVLLDGENAADLDVLYRLAQVLGHFDLGAGDGHGLGEALVVIFIKAQVDEFIEPFS